MKRKILAAALTLAMVGGVMAQEAGRSIIVLDASGSMWGQIEGRAKLEIAREALGEVLQSLPPDTELGLMAYGHRTKGECTDIELIVPPAAGTGPAIAEAAGKLQFLGKTPLSNAVRMAAGDLKSTEEKATVILITDGIETCNADPCALGAELEASGVDFTAHVVGFGLTADEGKQVACLAENTGGQYIEAKDAGSLKDALTTVVKAEPTPAPQPEPEPAPEPVQALEYNLIPQLYLAEGGPEVLDQGQAWEVYTIAANGDLGDYISTEYNQYRALLPAGKYRIRAKLGEATLEQDITVTDDALLQPQFILNAGTLILHPKIAADAEVDASASLNLTNAAGLDWTNYGNTTVVVPAMETLITLNIGQATVTETVTLKPGETLEKDVVVGAGLAVVNAFYVDGLIMDTTQHSVEILNAKQALDGSRNSLTTSYGPAQEFTLPPGDYVARVGQDIALGETPFTVKTGERVDVQVVLNAGVLAVTAPGANSIEVLDAKADINGNRTTRSFNYTDNLTLTAPGGDYVVLVMRGEVASEATATVKPGERTEVAVP
ncbi:vWA domain-containing protein [Neogemmobacter tilapiae]|uniref:VWA domain-containing protein n=1 Tax=Neogemmobacter tilapiae TaxID=875041 RepID=A0A918THI4_9RHOB|nr:VWA domain-containing protein [Gemmobacter tilapiae]GHC45525.1 VWA domain-containing protein [Gemmobacter tilapiae]